MNSDDDKTDGNKTLRGKRKNKGLFFLSGSVFMVFGLAFIIMWYPYLLMIAKGVIGPIFIFIGVVFIAFAK